MRLERTYSLDMNILTTCASRLFRGLSIFVSLCLLIFGVSPAVLALGVSDQYQVRRIPDPLISLSSEDSTPSYAILVEKETQRVMVYDYLDTFSLRHEFPCSTGEVAGRKQKSGDRRTPEGIYFFTAAFEKKHLAPIYGIGAFVLDYPNFIDRKFERAGNNIWLHGTDKPIKPRDSNGCIVMNNNDLEVLSQYIQLNRTPIIVAQKLEMAPAERRVEDLNSLISFLNGWKTAFFRGDWVSFSACYTKPYENLNALQKAWDSICSLQRHGQIPFSMSLQNVTLLRGNPCVVALFDQVMHLGPEVRSVSTKKLFLERTGRSWKITGETFQPDDPNRSVNPPLAAAVNHLGRLFTDRKAITDLVAEWADAWSSKDIRRYAACYAPDFQAREMDLRAWLRYKQSLNSLYDWIRVHMEGLSIEQGPKQSTVTFLQRYDSTGYQAVGTKRLVLKRIGGGWKIHREIWHSNRE